MALAIKRLKIPGIERPKRDAGGQKTIYNIAELKKHYMIGCQL
jgi:hypothetical protein